MLLCASNKPPGHADIPKSKPQRREPGAACNVRRRDAVACLEYGRGKNLDIAAPGFDGERAGRRHKIADACEDGNEVAMPRPGRSATSHDAGNSLEAVLAC